MDWTRQANARLIAVGYTVGFLAWLIAVVWILYGQFTGASAGQMVVGIVFFAIGQALMIVVAFSLRKNFPTSRAPSSFSQAWQRLSLGLELPPAVRLLLGR
ncbi:hypothetical protein ACFVWG_14045 [Kribbella sp. NPDC058245]|uniref:hypothetical protein n=1 Tax=Kribbella sp. NPDC058245 TaxID=3346399 RepID=UPI0036E1A2F9